MERPLIGITASLLQAEDALRLRLPCVRAVERAGGAPVVLPPMKRGALLAAARTCSGFLFSGGEDPHPALYSEEVLAACGPIAQQRDSQELALLEFALRRDLPVFGICRGVQILNVGLGGTLWQDLPGQTGTPLCHNQRPPFEMTVHTVQVDRFSLLYHITGRETLAVNSTHHQAVRETAPSLRAAAAAPDGTTEAVWRPESRFVLGVQWHPELLTDCDASAAALFAAFVEACRSA